jgi:2-polyprenyl-3-methyl-5-hydroxy-6-metoxy-1,4-benzoquinol methylase
VPAQIKYYNTFGDTYRQSILACPEPELWTTDYAEQGRVYREMKARIGQQQKLVNENFSFQWPVLDIGCRFGRQAVMLAKKGFEVTGCDTSDVFISICKELFEKFHFKGEFISCEIDRLQGRHFSQAILFDVIEHIPPPGRKHFAKQLASCLTQDAVLLLSLPHVKKRLTSQLNNSIRRRITGLFVYFRNKEEHPYFIPQKKDILQLFGKQFSLDSFKAGKETDYYVFRRKNDATLQS